MVLEVCPTGLFFGVCGDAIIPGHLVSGVQWLCFFLPGCCVFSLGDLGRATDYAAPDTVHLPGIPLPPLSFYGLRKPNSEKLH